MNTVARALPAAVQTQLVSLFDGGKWADLESAASTTTMRYPRNILGWRALGKSKLALGKLQDAIDVLSRAITFAPDEADIHNDLGSSLSGLARRKEAEASFRRALALDPRSPEIHINLGALLVASGRFDEAARCYRQALVLNPASAMAHNNLGNLFSESGRMAEAEASYRRALALKPVYLDAAVNLGSALVDLGRYAEAVTSYRNALRIDPNAIPALIALGRTLVRLGTDDDEAKRCLQRVLALDPDNANVHVDLGNVLMRQHQIEAAQRLFLRAQELQPLLTWRATGGNPAFSVVLLDTPLAGSTPLDYLAGRATYDRHFFCVVPGGGTYDDLLRERADVIFNMICNVDDGAEVLKLALDLVDRLGCPVVNHPRLVMNTDRETVARRLAAAVPGCVVPRTVRAAGTTLLDPASRAQFGDLTTPLLVRLAGTHGGDDFHKFDDWPSLLGHVATSPDATYYVTEFADYRSADGFFRKYRVIFVDGEILPYHLAIHDDWKVHHFRTDMANNAWMRREEEAFLANMGHLLDATQQDALRAMGRAIELDYCGIDFGLDRDGRLVVFECNAAMLVHDEKTEIFAYKNRHIAKIKFAFDAMLARRRRTVRGGPRAP